MIPAYSRDRVVLRRAFQGSTDADVFEDFIEHLLQHCNRRPAPKSVLIIDNASFHRTENIQRICSDASVMLVYLPPYSPDLNPIEEFSSELKQFIKRKWIEYKETKKKELFID